MQLLTLSDAEVFTQTGKAVR
uniref:Uncharacterized protein n=1 Tax=Rhizophora mucronata TaxID=61149 RepID=A0A2P2PFN9_RHIMU